MIRSGRAVSVALLVLGLVGASVPPGQASQVAAAEPEHTLEVSGGGASLYPEFDRGTARYGLRADSPLTVTASTTDPDGLVRVDGRPVTPGAGMPLAGLTDGDEVSVIIDDAGGTAVYSLVSLPTSFPDVDVVTDGAGRAPGYVFLALTDFFGGDRFEAVVDHNGVPVHVRRATNAMDLKLQPNGSYSVARADNTDLVTPYDIVEMDGRFEEVATHRTVGLGNTDFHDSILLPDGSRYLMAYEENSATDKVDSIVQHIDPSGAVLFEWNSQDHVDPELDGLTPLRDYAHLNSLDLTADGNLLLSFRHTSQVMKVARTAHDGWDSGDVIWRLGGRRSDFALPDDPYGGPCAQHTARELANGNILVFDNGSEVTPTTLEPMCADPADPNGDPVQRPQSRLVEYDVDPASGEARVAWSWERPGLFAEFAGSAQRLPGGNTLGGFASAAPDVVEVDPAGEVVWEMDIPDAFSYRALKFPAPDVIEPVVDLVAPAEGDVYERGAPVVTDFGCTDRGGSNLTTCDGTDLTGRAVDTSALGDHFFEVRATDGAGNVTVESHAYRVAPRWRPDAMVRKKKNAGWRGDGRYDDLARQSLGVTLKRTGGRKTVWFRVQNDGARPERIRLRGTRGTRAFRATWRAGQKGVTGRLVDGTFRTPRLEPGASFRLRVSVQRRAAAGPGQSRAFRLVATSAHQQELADTVRVRFRAR